MKAERVTRSRIASMASYASLAVPGRQNRLTGWLQSGAKRSDSATREDILEIKAGAAVRQTNGDRSSRSQAHPDAAGRGGGTVGQGSRPGPASGQTSKSSSKVSFQVYSPIEDLL